MPSRTPRFEIDFESDQSTEAMGEGWWTVSTLNQHVQSLLENQFDTVWVTGEISNLATPQSGHIYFSLKDPQSQIRCAFFRNRREATAPLPLANGLQVVVRGQLSLYAPRGDYQLIVRECQLLGQGMWEWEFQQRKQKLAAEGLFDPARKQPLPAFPHQIGVITSPTGAALQDILHVLKRRMPLIPITVYPSLVQGEEAPVHLMRALETAIADNRVDVLIVARGGGSIEDLWAFNDETWARMLAECPIPVISGVGHEIDWTITDLIADVRAPTPSAAAELVSPDQADFLADIRQARQHAYRIMRSHITQSEREWTFLQHRLQHAHPIRRIETQSQKADYLRMRLSAAMTRYCEKKTHRWKTAEQFLYTLSPFATLERGYAIVSDPDDPQKRIVDTAAQARTHARLILQFQDGTCEVYTHPQNS